MKAEAEPRETGETSSRDAIAALEMSKGISILDLILRIIAAIGTFASAMAMGTTNETLSIVPQFAQVTAEYDDLPPFMFFVIANSIVCGYLFLSLPFSIFHIIRTKAKTTRVISVIFDTVMLALITAGASSAAAMVYLAHKGNASANWLSFCEQFHSFCQRITGSLIGSFGTAVVFILIIITSSVALSRRMQSV